MAGLTGVQIEDLPDPARSLTELQRRFVMALHDRGPGMTVEVAVRVLRFSEEISQPLAGLRKSGLVAAWEFSGGIFGNELISLTATGERLARSLRNEAFRRQVASTETRGQSADLLCQAAALQQ